MTSGTPCRQQLADTEVAVYVETTSRPNAAHDLPQTPNMPHDPTGPSTSSVLQTDPPTFLRNVGGSVVGGATSVTAESRHCSTDRDSFPNVPFDPLEKVDGSARWHFSNHSPRTRLTHRSRLHIKLTHRPSKGGPPPSFVVAILGSVGRGFLVFVRRRNAEALGAAQAQTHLYQSDGSRRGTKHCDSWTWYMYTAHRSSNTIGNFPEIHAGSSLDHRKAFPAEHQNPTVLLTAPPG